MNWDDLRYFASFAASGSLSAAARALNVEHATIARRIAALESDLNLKLLDRRGRKLLLTAEGERIAAIADKMEFTAEEVLGHARSVSSELCGKVTISAPPAFAAVMLAAPLAALHRRHPHLSVFVSSDVHTVSLDRREADIAIRLRRPESGDLTAMKLGERRFRLYALPDFLARTAEENWDYIGLDSALAAAPQQTILGEKAGSPGLSTDQIEMQLALVRAGAGVAMLPEFLAVEATSLARAKPEAPPLIREIWLIYHSDMKNAGPIQAVVQELRSIQIPAKQFRYEGPLRPRENHLSRIPTARDRCSQRPRPALSSTRSKRPKADLLRDRRCLSVA